MGLVLACCVLCSLLLTYCPVFAEGGSGSLQETIADLRGGPGSTEATRVGMMPFVRVIGREELEGMAVETVEDVLENEANAVREGGLLHVRGGSGEDIVYVVDGLEIGFPPRRVGIALQDVEEIRIIDGGSVEHEGATVVDIATRRGRESRWSGRVLYGTDDYGGLRRYSFNTDRCELALGGSEPVTSALLPAVGIAPPGKLTFHLSGRGYWTDTYTPVEVEWPRHTWGGVKLGDRQKNDYYARGSISYELGPAKRLTVGYGGFWTREQEYQHEYKYAPQNACRERESSRQWNVEWNHLLAPGDSYRLQLGKVASSYSLDHGSDPGYFWTNRDSIAFGSSGRDSFGFYRQDGYDRWCIWHRDSTESWTLSGDVSVTPNRSHSLRLGLSGDYIEVGNAEIQYPYYRYSGDPDDGPWPDQGVIRDFRMTYPFSLAAYLQDELKSEKIVVRGGVSYRFWHPGKQVDVFVCPVTRDTVRVEPKQWLSPRLTMAYSSSMTDRMWLSFGVVCRMPPLRYLYKRSTLGASVTGMEPYGNPDLGPERTVETILGLDRVLGGSFTVGAVGFFRSITDLVAVKIVEDPPFQGLTFVNEGTGRVEGMIFRLSRRLDEYAALTMRYTLQWVKWDVELQNLGAYWSYPIRYSEGFSADWDRRHAVVANLGLRAPGSVRVNMLWRFGSGLPFTASWPLSEADEGVNARRMPAVTTFDLKARKGFHLGPARYWLLVEARNVFDRKNVIRVHEDTGMPGGETPEGEWEEIRHDPANWGLGRNVSVGLSVGW